MLHAVSEGWKVGQHCWGGGGGGGGKPHLEVPPPTSSADSMLSSTVWTPSQHWVGEGRDSDNTVTAFVLLALDIGTCEGTWEGEVTGESAWPSLWLTPPILEPNMCSK